MPFKSEAQRRRLHKLAKEGKMNPVEVAKWEMETRMQGKKLPERLSAPKRKPKK